VQLAKGRHAEAIPRRRLKLWPFPDLNPGLRRQLDDANLGRVKLWRFGFFGLAAALVFFAWRAEYNHDEIEHLHATWLMSVGQRPYTDFLEQHHPTLWIVLQPLVSQVASPRWLVFSVRLYDLLLLGVLLFTLHRLVRRLHPDAAPWASLLVLGSYTFAHNMMLFRPDPTMNALFFAGLLQWAAFLQEGRLGRAAWAGLFFGLAVAVLQKALVVCGLVGLAVAVLLVVHRGQRRRELAKGAGMALAAALLPIGALLGWVAARGIWRDFWFWNYEFNGFFYTQAKLSMHFGLKAHLVRSVVEDVALWAFGAVGVGLWLRKKRSWDAGDDIRLTVLLTLLGYLAFLTFNRFPFEQYFIVFLPLWAPFAAGVLARWPVTRLACVAMVAVTLGSFIELSDNARQRRVQDFILAHTTVDDTIAVSPPYHPITRFDASRYWYNGVLMGEASAAYEQQHPGVIHFADEWRNPAFVYLDPDFPSYWPYRWEAHAPAYQPTEVPDLLRRVDHRR
jgi:hypothetical protein